VPNVAPSREAPASKALATPRKPAPRWRTERRILALFPGRRGADQGGVMIHIAISFEAFEAIARTLPVGSVGYEAEANEWGERLIVMVGVGLGYIVTDAI
jgi:hypothetical protein